MTTLTDQLEAMLKTMECEWRLGQGGLDCIEAINIGIRQNLSDRILCPRCKIKKRLEDLTIDMPPERPALGK
jgi:hypothetical protein